MSALPAESQPRQVGVPPMRPELYPIRHEIRTYRRELPRLLMEGQEGRFALIKGDQVDSIWDTADDALQAGYDKFGFTPFLAQPIESRYLTAPYPPELSPDAKD